MSLEFADLVLTVENSFGFSIPDEDAAGLDTMDKLYDYILAHRFPKTRKACLNSVAFYKIRRAIMSVLRLSRREVQASTKMKTVAPAHRRRVWQALEKATGFRLPQLRRPAWVMTAAVLATIAISIAVPVFLSLTLFNGAILVALLTAAATGYCFSWLTIPLAFEFQPDCTTVGQLVTGTLARNYRAIVDETNKCASDAEVWDTLCVLMAEQLGVRAADLTKEADFVGDRNACLTSVGQALSGNLAGNLAVPDSLALSGIA